MTGIPRLSYAAAAAIPLLSVEQMIEVDRAMIEDHGILLLQMIEHAGRHLANLARRRFLGGDVRHQTVVVLAGPGGNGGGALVCARLLANWGARVSIAVATGDEAFAEVPRHQLAIARRLGMTVERVGGLGAAVPSVIIDGVIGYSLRGAPRGEAAALIRWANAAPAAVLALDVPSGLDATTGMGSEVTIEAAATLTLALPKRGLRAAGARRFVGDLYLADIGVPPQIYARPSLALEVPLLFAEADLVRLP